LPVLTRWIASEDVEGGVPVATYLDLIFYNRAQMDGAQGSVWSLISIKGQTEPFELPMLPITAMRNALGSAYGGSNEPIDPVKYQQSVQFWSDHVAVV
jgi:hypothetical protein